jgi:putative endonuclease
MPSSSWTCYVLANARGHTYVGKTNDVRRRLRQHAGELRGGARGTRGRGPWALVAAVRGFVDARDALTFEYRAHHPPVRRRRGGCVAARLRSLADVAGLERATRRGPLAASRRLTLHVGAPYYRALLDADARAAYAAAGVDIVVDDDDADAPAVVVDAATELPRT